MRHLNEPLRNWRQPARPNTDIIVLRKIYVKHFPFRAWLIGLGLWWLVIAFNQFAFLHGERDFLFYLYFVLAPGVTAVTMLLMAMRGSQRG